MLAAFPDIIVVPCTQSINTSMTSLAVRESPINSASCMRENSLTHCDHISNNDSLLQSCVEVDLAAVH